MTDSPRVVSCPSCGAALRPDAEWCSLCFHDLRAPVAPPAPAPQAVDPLTAPLLDVALPVQPSPVLEPAPVAPPAPAVSGPAWPCTRCGAVNDLGTTVCGTCGAGFLDAVSAKPELVLPGVGNLHALTRGQRAGLALAALLVVLLPLALITYLSTGAPPKDTGPSTPGTVVTSP